MKRSIATWNQQLFSAFDMNCDQKAAGKQSQELGVSGRTADVKRANGICKIILLKGNIHAITLQVEFEWDPKKETLNLAKHGVSFVEAQSAFLDPLRVIAVDEAHSKKEPRLFCIGRSQRGIVTVRFIQRGDRIRIIGAGYWRKGKQLYEKTNR